MWHFGGEISSVANSAQPQLGQCVMSSPVQSNIQSASVFGSFDSDDEAPNNSRHLASRSFFDRLANRP